MSYSSQTFLLLSFQMAGILSPDQGPPNEPGWSRVAVVLMCGGKCRGDLQNSMTGRNYFSPFLRFPFSEPVLSRSRAGPRFSGWLAKHKRKGGGAPGTPRISCPRDTGPVSTGPTSYDLTAPPKIASRFRESKGGETKNTKLKDK